jgi:hypothetical protein
MMDFALVRSINPSAPILIWEGTGTCFIRQNIFNPMIPFR